MKLLAIETSTEACSVALLIDGEVRELHEIAPRRHTELVLPWASQLLAEAGIARSQLDAIAVGRGPGAFTGVRLAVALVQGMALALDRPVLPISTLAALAAPLARAMLSDGAVPGLSGILATIDARMGELYLGLFVADATRLVRELGEEWMALPSQAVLPHGLNLVGAGTGFAAGDGALVHLLAGNLRSFDAAALPHAADIAALAALAYDRGEAIAPDLLQPAYLRNKVALTLLEQHAARDIR